MQVPVRMKRKEVGVSKRERGEGGETLQKFL